MDRKECVERVAALGEGSRRDLPLLANVGALLAETLEDINWVGFYLADETGDLWLGPFQGRVACTLIRRGRGVCGTAAQRGETVCVEDVTTFAGHIACDARSRSEIVVPLFWDGRLYGVLDVDSASLSRFGARDRADLEAVARALENHLVGTL